MQLIKTLVRFYFMKQFWDTRMAQCVRRIPLVSAYVEYCCHDFAFHYTRFPTFVFKEKESKYLMWNRKIVCKKKTKYKINLHSYIKYLANQTKSMSVFLFADCPALLCLCCGLAVHDSISAKTSCLFESWFSRH